MNAPYDNAIDEEAVRWVARRDGARWTDEDQARLDHWLAQDTRHRGAWLRAQAAWTSLDRASVAAAGGRKAPTAPRPGRRAILGFGLAGATAVAAAAIGAFVFVDMRGVNYGTALGEVRQVPLADGSRLVINTGSEVAVDLEPRERRLRLEQGEAWFEVAKDPRRPFVVTSGSTRVTAVGTAFSVRRRAEGVDVLVTEGVVSIKPRVLGGGEPIRVAAGYRVFVDARGVVSPAVHAVGEIDRALAWRSGQIVLDGETLGEAVAEFNRYNARKIVIEDQALSHERLVGWFRTDEPESFARAAANMLGFQVIDRGDQIHLQSTQLRKNIGT